MALYPFYDTIQTPGAAPLPAEAVCYNGVWIDNDIPQFRTLYVSGRESFSMDITETALESMDGAAFLRRRLLPRTIIVGYQMVTSSASEFMTAFNRLNRLMSGAQVRVSFADEPDKYYTGTCRSIGTPDPGKLAAKAEMEIYCTDPRKYAATETTVSSNSSGVFAIEYGGSYPVRPSFVTSFSGSTRQVAFAGADSAVISAGNASGSSGYAFVSGDRLLIDCAAAKIYLNNISAPALGDIANQFEEMQLAPGSNVITTSYTGAKPTFQLKYRTAWL